MKTKRSITRSFSLALALVGMIGWNTVPIHSWGHAAQGATNGSLGKQTGQPSSRAVGNGKIAFVSATRTDTELYTMNSDGSDRVRLTSGQGDLDPAWSPDGTQIAFARTYHFCSRAEVFVMRADGSDLRRLTQSGIDRYPTWSPDSSQIAFVRAGECNDYGPIVVMNADGSNPRTIESGRSTRPAWSPNGSQLAFEESYSIFLIDADGSNRSVIATPPSGTLYSDPAWSPDGSTIAFTRWADCDVDDCYDVSIWVVSADGSNPAKIADVYGYYLDWSSDGTRIIFTNGSDLFIMNSDGSSITNITATNDEGEFAPSWQPFSLTGCTDSISPTSQSFEANGGTSSIEVNAANECNWTAACSASWISVISGNSSGNGSVLFSIGVNTGTSPRRATIVIAARSFNVTQAGVPVRIIAASIAGKKLFVSGQNFDPGAVILLNDVDQVTLNDHQNPMTTLIGKKAGKKIKPGDRLQVRNPNGTHSQEFTFISS